jgi:hypothetical protein
MDSMVIITDLRSQNLVLILVVININYFETAKQSYASYFVTCEST